MSSTEAFTLTFLCDEDFDNNILRGLLRRVPALNITRVQDAGGLSGKRDEAVLEWAAQQGRIVLTHDVNTMTEAAYKRIMDNKPLPGLCVVPRLLSTGTAIEDLVLIAECSVVDDWAGLVRCLPL